MKFDFSVVRSDGKKAKVYSVDLPAIVIGRADDCDVQLDAEIVSSRHAEITQRNGKYLLTDVGSTNGTYIAGERLSQTHQLSINDVVTFGVDGPQIAVRKLAPSNAETVQQRRAAAQAVVVDLQTSTRRWGQLTVFTLCCMAFMIAGIFYSLIDRLYDSREGTRNLADATSNLKDKTIALSEDVSVNRQNIIGNTEQIEESRRLNAEKLYRDYGRAVFRPIYETERDGSVWIGSGTAFAISKDGLFATNSHVAEPILLSLKQGFRPVVVGQGGEPRLEIIEAKMHPDYEQNGEVDVAWLRVKVPSDVELTVAQLATDYELANITGGTEACYIGFPAYNRLSYKTPEAVLARVYVGNIVRVMTPDKEVGSFSQAYEFEHNMYSWGGASGSPVFNRDGKVIALHYSSGNVSAAAHLTAGEGNNTESYPVEITGMRSFASEKFAVRVDKLREILPK